MEKAKKDAATITIQSSDTTEKVIKYLAQGNIIPKRLYQYTSYQALVSILTNRTFRLSRTDLLNDKAEMKLGNEEDLKRSYVMSFTEDSEYVSMWTMYGKSIGIKLRLDFETSKLKAIIEGDNFWFFDKNANHISIKDRNKPLFEIVSKRNPIRLSRVAYYNPDSKTIRAAASSKDFPLVVDEKVIEEMTGFIKFSAWEAERETRLRIVLKPDVIGLEDIKFVNMTITDEMIKGFRITFNPWMPDELKIEIQHSLDHLAGFPLRYTHSVLTGQVDESILHS